MLIRKHIDSSGILVVVRVFADQSCSTVPCWAVARKAASLRDHNWALSCSTSKIFNWRTMSTTVTSSSTISFFISPDVTNTELNKLFATAWPNHTASDFQPVLQRSLAYVCAYADSELVGFVNLAWDGSIHAFILDTTVHARCQRQGIGTKLLHHAIQVARARGIVWLHVDYEPHLDAFYCSSGFRPTMAGLLNVEEQKI